MSADHKQVSVTVDVGAGPEIVWKLVADLSRMGEWSPECDKVTWVGGGPGPAGPAVGSTFKGRNRIGIRRWTTKGTIVAAESERALAWDVRSFGLPVARWSYRIEGTGGGCRVTESWEDHRTGFLARAGALATGVKDRAAHNQAGMAETLRRLKTAAEAGRSA